jgi:hypothetical protein
MPTVTRLVQSSVVVVLFAAPTLSLLLSTLLARLSSSFEKLIFDNAASICIRTLNVP